MPKAMTIFGLVVAGLIGLVFAMDLIVGVPFEGARTGMNIGALIAAVILGYVSYSTMRELR